MSESVSEPAQVPLQLVERDREDRDEEEPVEHRLGEDAFPRWSDRERERLGRHATSSRSFAISSTLARRDSRSSSRRGELDGGQSAVGEARVQLDECGLDPVDVVGGRDDVRARSLVSSSAAAPSGGTTARIGRPAAMYSKTFPERTPFPLPPASGTSSRSASESRCRRSDSARGEVLDELEPVAEVERLAPTRDRTSGSRRRSVRRRRGRRRGTPAGTAAGPASRRSCPCA